MYCIARTLQRTYRHYLEDIELGGVQFLGFAVCRNRDWYEAEVLGEQDDQHCGPVCMRRTVISIMMQN